MPIITTALVERKVAKRTKVYDTKVAGFYVSITKAGVATFALKYTNRKTGQRDYVEIGVYHPDLLTVDQARSQAYLLKGRADNGEDLAAERRLVKETAVKQGKTVDEVIEEYLAWMKRPEKKHDGQVRAYRESWETTAQYLYRFASTRLGKKIVSEVTNRDIAKLQTDIREGRMGKPSVSNARHTRVALSGMFKWCAQADREYVTASPCVNLPKLPKIRAKDRSLSDTEIKMLWHGLDRDDLPCDRVIALALKFQLVTMMRQREFLRAQPSELERLSDHISNKMRKLMTNSPLAKLPDLPLLHVPLCRTKKRTHDYIAVLTSLAQSIIAEAQKEGCDYIFSVDGKTPLSKTALSQALRGVKYKGKVKRLASASGWA